MTSRISGFYSLGPKERLNYLKKFAHLSEEEVKLLSSSGALGLELADRMIENVIGFMHIPLGIACMHAGFIVNGKEYQVPMACMAARGAEFARTSGGFKASSTGSTMIGQIQLANVRDPEKTKEKILVNKEKILQEANTQSGTRKACMHDFFSRFTG